MTEQELRQATAAVCGALRPHVSDGRNPGTTTPALEAARNIAAMLSDGVEDPLTVAREALRHRMRHGWLRVGDLDMATTCAANAWHRATGRLAIAVVG